MAGFNNDPFEDLVREFFGSGGTKGRQIKTSHSGENQSYSSNFNAVVNELDLRDSYYYIIFIPEKVSSDQINLERDGSTLKLMITSSDSELHIYLPKSLKNKKFTFSLVNGILEVRFEK